MKWHWRFGLEKNASMHSGGEYWWKHSLLKVLGTLISQRFHSKYWDNFTAHTVFYLLIEEKSDFGRMHGWVIPSKRPLLFPDIFCLASLHDGSVAEFSSPQGWNLFLRRTISNWEVERISLLSQRLSNLVLDLYKHADIKWKDILRASS